VLHAGSTFFTVQARARLGTHTDTVSNLEMLDVLAHLHSCTDNFVSNAARIQGGALFKQSVEDIRAIMLRAANL